jgi:hypothetical protein
MQPIAKFVNVCAELLLDEVSDGSAEGAAAPRWPA